MTGIIDFHAHAFPDKIAKEAIPSLEEEGNVKAFLNGTITELLSSMDRAGIDKSVICSIATRPAQFDAILAWSTEIRSERIIPFPSIHPADPLFSKRLEEIRAAGFTGIKMHPYYQDFYIDEQRLYPIYEKISSENLILVMHTGFDIAFPRLRRADPAQVINVMSRFPELKLVTTHLGSWELWDEVAEFMIGRQIYMDISYSFDFLDRKTIRQMLLDHPQEYIIFGTDSPWADQHTAVKQLKELDLGEERERCIFSENAQRLLKDSENK